jgi:DNA replication protein DnaC
MPWRRSSDRGEHTAALQVGLRRLKLAAVRRLAPEICQTAKVQRWAPQELLRTLVEAEIVARERSNLDTRLRQAGFPVRKALEEFQLQLSSVPQPTFNYLSSLEWIRAKANVCLIGPAGTGKSHLLVGLGHAAVGAGFRVRYFAAADLVETLCRSLADNSVGTVIDQLPRADLVILCELGFAPLDLNGSQLPFRFVATAYERRSLGIASHWPFDQCARFLPEQTTTVSMFDRLLHHASVVVTDGESYHIREAKTRGGTRLQKA